jgi:hypothetical protein
MRDCKKNYERMSVRMPKISRGAEHQRKQGFPEQRARLCFAPPRPTGRLSGFSGSMDAVQAWRDRIIGTQPPEARNGQDGRRWLGTLNGLPQSEAEYKATGVKKVERIGLLFRTPGLCNEFLQDSGLFPGSVHSVISLETHSSS